MVAHPAVVSRINTLAGDITVAHGHCVYATGPAFVVTDFRVVPSDTGFGARLAP